jgi:hypothetical protein
VRRLHLGHRGLVVLLHAALLIPPKGIASQV